MLRLPLQQMHAFLPQKTVISTTEARDCWDRDRDRHDSIRDTRNRNRDRDIRDRRPKLLWTKSCATTSSRALPLRASYGDDRRGGL
ncbi:hypothetical protein OG21DRAFT_1244819 [Imleria badia]|nr:hypothetical protein OG21DRAFT_1244819 [Imleria badia]